MSVKDTFCLRGYLKRAGEQSDSLFLILVGKGLLVWSNAFVQCFEYQVAGFQVSLSNKVLSKLKGKRSMNM